MSNARNTITVIGYAPSFEKDKYTKYVAGSDNKKAYYRGKVGVRRSFKDRETGKYQYDNIPFKAFGNNADYLYNYCNHNGGDIISISGEVRIEDNYEDKDGNVVYGTPYISVDNVAIISSSNGAAHHTASGNDNNGSKSAVNARPARSASKGGGLASVLHRVGAAHARA